MAVTDVITITFVDVKFPSFFYVFLDMLGFRLDFGWIWKKKRRLFKVEILKSNFQRSINVRFSMLYQRQVFNIG